MTHFSFSTPTIIDFAAEGCGFLGSSILGDPFELTTGNLTLKGYIPDTHKKVSKFILDHLLLWEWEEAPFAHRLSGLIWVAMCLGCTGADWAAAKWYFSPAHIYMSKVWAASGRTGFTYASPLKPNKPFDPSVLAEVRIEVTGSPGFEQKIPVADLTRFLLDVHTQRNANRPTRWNNTFRGWATLRQLLLQDGLWRDYPKLQVILQRPRGGPFINFRTEITAWVRAWSLQIGGAFGVLNFTMSMEVPTEAIVSITES